MLRRMDVSDLPRRLQQIGSNQSELARFLGLDPSSLTKTIKGERHLKADELLKIDAFFEAKERGVQPLAQNVEPLAPRRNTAPSRIPVYGYAAAGPSDSIVFNPGQVIDWIAPPPLWNGTGDLVAIRVLGSSMEPRLFAGEMIIAQLGLPPQKERDCVIEFNDGSALVKTYEAQKNGFVFARQWNPEEEIRVPGASVKAIHAVIWRR